MPTQEEIQNAGSDLIRLRQLVSEVNACRQKEQEELEIRSFFRKFVVYECRLREAASCSPSDPIDESALQYMDVDGNKILDNDDMEQLGKKFVEAGISVEASVPLASAVAVFIQSRAPELYNKVFPPK